MKRILFLITLLTLISGYSYGYSYSFDSTANMPYVTIQPVTWVYDNRPARLYLKTNNDNQLVSADIVWQIRVAVEVSPSVYVYRTINTGTIPLTGASYQSWNKNNPKYLFDLVSDIKSITIL